jgi:hypothetical protein
MDNFAFLEIIVTKSPYSKLVKYTLYGYYRL